MNFMEICKREAKKLLIFSFVINIFLAGIIIILQNKEDRIIFDCFGSSLRIFNLMMDDYNEDIKNAKDINEKVEVIRDLIIRIDRLQSSFRYAEDRFTLSFNPLANYVAGIDLDKFKQDPSYNTQVIYKLDEFYTISVKIKDMGYTDFYKNHNMKILRLKPSDKIVNYFNEMNKLALQE